MRRIEPALAVIEETEKAWAKDDEQARIRAEIVLQKLVLAGMFPGAEIVNGVVVQRLDVHG